MHNPLQSKNLIDYIENNLTDDLNLDHMAKLRNYSKYHFLRLFLNEMGVSPVHYIKRRRIIRSSQLLLTSEMHVMDIGFEVGFSNVDTFIRGFKSYYGITPLEYRRYHKRAVKCISEEGEEMMNKEILKVCSKEEKKTGLSHIEQVIKLSKLAHKKGLLSLGDEVTSEPRFLNKAIELMLNGTKPNTLRDILENYIHSSELSPGQLLERIIYMEGLLLIQKGEYPWDILVYLKSLLGERFIDAADEYFQTDANQQEMLNKYVSDKQPNSELFKLAKELKNMNDRSMQRLLRECDMIIVTIAFMGTDNKLKHQLIKNLSKYQQSIFVEVIEMIETPSLAMIADAQSEIIKTIKDLRRENDIE